MTAPVPITTVVTASVPWVQFRRALCAVLPHASKDADWPALCRVRVEVRPDGAVLISATDRFTAGLARLEAHVPPDETHQLDLHPDEVRKVLAVFREVKEDLDYTLQLVASTEQLEVRDVSGMVDGERLAVNLMPPTDEAPNLPARFSEWAHRQPVDTKRPALPLEAATRFKPALKCYDETLLRMSMIGLNTALIFVGDDFTGFIAGVEVADRTDLSRTSWAAELSDDLPPAARDRTVVDLTDWTTELTDDEDSDA